MLALFLVGCAGRGSDIRNERTYAPLPGQALIVFMRPARWMEGGAQLFDITSDDWILIASLIAKTKIAYNVAPGKYRFMVIGDNADFLDAEVLEGKTYFATIGPRIGYQRPRYVLGAVHKLMLATVKFAKWNRVTKWVEGTQQWQRSAARDDAGRIKKLHDRYLPVWLGKANKPVLLPDDGQ